MSPSKKDNGEFSGDDDALAGEYVLGVLDGEVRRAVARRLAHDADFAGRVDRWQADLAPLNAHYAEERVPPGLYATIEKRLFGTQEPEKPVKAAGGFWQSLAVWRTLAFASLLLVCGLAIANILFFMNRGDVTPTATLRAELTSTGSSVDLIALYTAETGTIDITPVAAGLQEERSLELWMIPAPDTPPVSLGIIPADGRGEIVLDEAARERLRVGATFAISLEPQGGSPSGAPTGPVIASGTAEEL